VSPPILVAALLVAAGLVNAVLFLALGIGLAPFARVLVERAALGVGPRLFTLRVAGVPIEIRAVPASSYLVVLGMSPLTPEDAPRPPPPLVLWLEASRLRRVLAFVIAPRLATFGVAAAVLGLPRAGGAVARGVVEVIQGALAPLSTGALVLRSGAGVLAREGVATFAMVALCKWLAFSLLTLPTDVAPAVARTHERRVGVARVVAMLGVFAVWAAWAVAWIAWAWR
jgi:multisubunit Na+/H+ antiporter MnhB subunit